MSCNPVIKLRALCFRKRHFLRFKAFPQRVKQLHLLRGGEAVYLVSEIAHTIHIAVSADRSSRYCIACITAQNAAAAVQRRRDYVAK